MKLDPENLPPRRRRVRPALLVALALSVLAHFAWSLWPVHPPEDDVPPPLAVSITELPPPPPPSAVGPAPKARPKPKRLAAPSPPPVPTVAAADSSPSEIEPAAETPPAADPRPVVEAPAVEAAAPVPVPAEPEHTLPPRIDLAYRAFLGTRGFLIGDAIYRLEHGASRYSISTVAEARGLVALFYRGQAKARSEGSITRAGLQPATYSIERTSSDRRETATFDWDAGVVQLGDDKSMTLEPPTFDPLVVLWQFYFAPPQQDSVRFNIATTRKIYHYAFHREGTEKIALPFGDVDTEIWKQDEGDGSITAQIWLAPSLHFVAVKVRMWNERATIETLLDSIHVDETVAQQ